MWGVDPSVLCRKHLLGEHLEMHMFAGALRKGRSLQGYIDGGLVDVHRIPSRHDALVREMEVRGYKHSTPIPRDIEYPIAAGLDLMQSLCDLLERCPECRARLAGG